MYNKILKTVNNKSYIDGVEVKELVSKYSTPLIVYSQSEIERKLKLFKDNFKSDYFQTKVIYASKAFSCKAIYQLLSKYDFGVDVVSDGELYTALKGNTLPKNIFFHGNNKSIEELKMAIDNNIDTIIVDNVDELNLIKSLTNKEIKILLRVNPGIEAHTHDYIKTALIDSKFGTSILDFKTFDEVIKIINDSPNIKLCGIHCHIGSQIFDPNSFFRCSEVMIEFLKQFNDKYNLKLDELNLGGGFGISISNGDTPFDFKDFLNNLIKRVEELLVKHNVYISKLMIEPGRSLVSEEALTIYKIGKIKKTINNLTYYFIDGGMSDNIRPSLYQAKYEADVLDKINEKKNKVATIAGKLCESGDILIKDIKIQDADVGDLLVVYSTGAYTYSMASNYNKNLRPAVVFCKNSLANLVIKREEYEDLIKNDLDLKD